MNIDVGSQWYNRIASDISGYQITLGPKDAKKYRLDQILSLARRIDEYSGICAECQAYQPEITGMVRELGLIIQMPVKGIQKKLQQSITRIIEHLKKVHKLVDKGHYMGIGIGVGMAVGAVIGAGVGAVADNPGIGTGIGIALGAAVGAYLDKRAKEQGKVI